MSVLGLLGSIIANLPTILRILALLDKRQKEGATNAKIETDLKAIEDAFASKDAAALNKLFNS